MNSGYGKNTEVEKDIDLMSLVGKISDSFCAKYVDEYEEYKEIRIVSRSIL